MVRPGALFGPGPARSTLALALARLCRDEKVLVPTGCTLSPTYAPDLAHACLDLAIAGASGAIRLANGAGPVSVAEWLRRLCEALGVDASGVVPVDGAQNSSARPCRDRPPSAACVWRDSARSTARSIAMRGRCGRPARRRRQGLPVPQRKSSGRFRCERAPSDRPPITPSSCGFQPDRRSSRPPWAPAPVPDRARRGRTSRAPVGLPRPPRPRAPTPRSRRRSRRP